jgi:hypothetical protein
VAQGLVGDRSKTEGQKGVVSPQDIISFFLKTRIISKNWPTIMQVHNNSPMRMKSQFLITLYEQI